MTRSEAIRYVRSVHPFAIAKISAGLDTPNWEIVVSHAWNATKIVWEQHDEESAWLAAADRLKPPPPK